MSVIVVPVGQDDVGDIGLASIQFSRLVQEGLLEYWDIFVLPLAGVDEDVRIAFSDEVCIRPCLTIR